MTKFIESDIKQYTSDRLTLMEIKREHIVNLPVIYDLLRPADA